MRSLHSFRGPLALAALVAALLGLTPLRADADRRQASLERGARRFFKALLAGKRAACAKQLLSYSEIRKLGAKFRLTKAQYDKLNRRWLDKRIAELAAARRKGAVQLKKIELLDAQLLYDPGKLNTVAVLARPVFRHGGKRIAGGRPFYFLAFEGRWKISIKM